MIGFCWCQGAPWSPLNIGILKSNIGRVHSCRQTSTRLKFDDSVILAICLNWGTSAFVDCASGRREVMDSFHLRLATDVPERRSSRSAHHLGPFLPPADWWGKLMEAMALTLEIFLSTTLVKEVAYSSCHWQWQEQWPWGEELETLASADIATCLGRGRGCGGSDNGTHSKLTWAGYAG